MKKKPNLYLTTPKLKPGEIKRWDMAVVNSFPPCTWDMIPAPFGVYVEHDDHKKVVAKLHAEIAKLKGGRHA
jgi:hypothetical protein